jgi:hypothetical protein
VEKFVDFQIPEDLQGEYGTLSVNQKKKILGLNAARLYDIKVPGELDVVDGADESGAIGSTPEPEAATA